MTFSGDILAMSMKYLQNMTLMTSLAGILFYFWPMKGFSDQFGQKFTSFHDLSNVKAQVRSRANPGRAQVLKGDGHVLRSVPL